MREATFKGQLALFKLDLSMKISELEALVASEHNYVVYFPAKKIVKIIKYIPANQRAVIQIGEDMQQVKIHTLSRIYFVTGYDYFNNIQKKIQVDVTTEYITTRGEQVDLRRRAAQLNVTGSIFGGKWQDIKLL